MNSLLRTPVTFVWLLLMAATGLSLWLAVDHGISDVRASTVIVMTVAMIKVYLVGTYFMELRHAPWILLGVFQAWCIGSWAGVLGVYLFG